MWQFFYYATTEIVCTILTNWAFNCLYVATCLLLDLVMFTCAYDSFLSIFNSRTAQTKLWGKIVCYVLRQWFNVYIRPQEKSTEKINGSRRHKEMHALEMSKNHALRAAHILGSLFFFAFFHSFTKQHEVLKYNVSTTTWAYSKLCSSYSVRGMLCKPQKFNTGTIWNNWKLFYWFDFLFIDFFIGFAGIVAKTL